MIKEAELAHTIHYTCSAVRRAAAALNIAPVWKGQDRYYTEEQMEQIHTWLHKHGR